MATHAKFLIEFISITFAAILAMLYPSPGFQLGMILVMVTRFALLGDGADVWSIRWLTIVTAIALYRLATGAPFSWAIMLFKPATSQTLPE